MGRLIIAANWIQASQVYGHLQIVYNNAPGQFSEIEVQAPNPLTIPFGGTWVFPTIRDHTDIQNTQGYGSAPARYGAQEVALRDGQDVDAAWNILQQVHAQLATAYAGLDYNFNQNSNAYANTLLSIIGVDVGSYLGSITPSLAVSGFPSVTRDVLVDTVGGTEVASLELTGLDGNDFIQTGSGNDTLIGGGGDDSLIGRDGDDLILGGQGDDYIVGGEGDDQFSGGQGNDYIVGGEGDDQFSGGQGNDFFDGQDGIDFIDYSGSLTDEDTTGSNGIYATVTTEIIDDRSELSMTVRDTWGDHDVASNVEWIIGGLDDDILNVVGDIDWTGIHFSGMVAGSEREGSFGDTVNLTSVSALPTILTVSLADQVIDQIVAETSTPAGSTIEILDFENVAGSDFADIIIGSEENNILLGGGGDDIISGGAGDDFILFDGTDVIDGGEDFDVGMVQGTIGVSVNMAETGLEVLIGGEGADMLSSVGSTGTVLLAGGDGNDHFTIAENGATTTVIWGGGGADIYDFADDQAGILTANVSGLTEDNFHTFTLDMLDLGSSFDWSQIDAVILNPEASDQAIVQGQTIEIESGSIEEEILVYSAFVMDAPDYVDTDALISGRQSVDLSYSLPEAYIVEGGFYGDATRGVVTVGTSFLSSGGNLLVQGAVNSFFAAFDSQESPIPSGLGPADYSTPYAFEAYVYEYSDGSVRLLEGRSNSGTYQIWAGFNTEWTGGFSSFSSGYGDAIMEEASLFSDWFVVGGSFSGTSLSPNGTISASMPADGTGLSISDWLQSLEGGSGGAADGNGPPDTTDYNQVSSTGGTSNGSEGSDRMTGSDDSDDLRAGDGDDYLEDGGGTDQLRGGAGADYFAMSADWEADRIMDFEANVDIIGVSAWGVSSFDQLELSWNGNQQSGYIRFGSEEVRLDGISESDFNALTGDAFTFAPEGTALPTQDPWVDLSGNPDLTGFNIIQNSGGGTSNGTSGSDSIHGSNSTDDLRGQGGQDYFVDGGGTDKLRGGAGADYFAMSADWEADRIMDFEANVDIIDVSAWGVTSIDQLEFSWHSNQQSGYIRFGREEIRVDGISESDFLALAENTFVFAPEGTLLPTQAAWTDLSGDPDLAGFNGVQNSGGGTSHGTSGSDAIYGSASNDDLRGYGGQDYFVDGAGSDKLRGGAGADYFEFSFDGEQDRIMDFDVGLDVLDLSKWGVTSMADLTFTQHNSNDVSYISYANETIQLDGVTLADLNTLTVSDFVFV